MKVYEKTCKHCGDEYTTNRKIQKYCSMVCAGAAAAQRSDWHRRGSVAPADPADRVIGIEAARMSWTGGEVKP